MNRRIIFIILATAAAVVVAAVAIQRWTNRIQESPAPALVPAAAVEGKDAEAAFAVRIRAESAVYRSGEPFRSLRG